MLFRFVSRVRVFLKNMINLHPQSSKQNNQEEIIFIEKLTRTKELQNDLKKSLDLKETKYFSEDTF